MTRANGWKSHHRVHKERGGIGGIIRIQHVLTVLILHSLLFLCAWLGERLGYLPIIGILYYYDSSSLVENKCRKDKMDLDAWRKFRYFL